MWTLRIAEKVRQERSLPIVASHPKAVFCITPSAVENGTAHSVLQPADAVLMIQGVVEQDASPHNRLHRFYCDRDLYTRGRAEGGRRAKARGGLSHCG